MSDRNLSAVLYARNDLRLVDRPVPEPGSGQVLLEMQQVGICGSDVHFLTNGRIGDKIVKAPMVLGHESSAVVSKLGPNVTGLSVGDRVAVEPGVPCRVCNFCKIGRYNLCDGVRFCASPPNDGTLARYFVHDADFCFKLPDHVTFEEGALLEPLSVAVHATNRTGVGLGHTVLVCGAGPIGLVHILTCKARGASVVCVTDIDQSRLEVAKQIGADHVVRVTSKDSLALAQAVEAAVGDKVDITMECSGAEASTQTAIYATKPGGTVILVGLGHEMAQLPIVNASVREIDIKGTKRYANCYPTALAMVASGKVNVKPLVTHRFTLEESSKAFDTARKGEGIKVMIKCSRGPGDCDQAVNMSDRNLSAVLYARNDLRLVDRPVPEPGSGQVLLEMQQVGICGSDVHFLTNGRIGDYIVKAPMVLGHESSAVVSKLGPNVTGLSVGDRVAVEPGVPCRVCNFCKIGRYNLCDGVRFCACPPSDGTLARYFVHDADFCFKLPDHVTFEEGALLEPLSVAVHATNRAGVGLGHTVLVCGAGPIGLVHILTCKARGASVVCVTDIDQSRLEVAKQIGADHVVKVTSKDSLALAQAVEAAVGDKVDITMECSGAEASTQTAIYATKPGGTVVLVGLGHEMAQLPIVNASVREIDIKGTTRYANCYPTALAMVASGKVNVKPLVTHRFTLEESSKAFDTAKKGEGIKVMIKCSRG